MDKETIHLVHSYRSPIDLDYSAFIPVKWLELIGFSWFNQVPSSQEMKGDLLLRSHIIKQSLLLVAYFIKGL